MLEPFPLDKPQGFFVPIKKDDRSFTFFCPSKPKARNYVQYIARIRTRARTNHLVLLVLIDTLLKINKLQMQIHIKKSHFFFITTTSKVATPSKQRSG